MKITDEDIVTALEGRPSKAEQQHNDRVITAIEGKPTSKKTVGTAQKSKKAMSFDELIVAELEGAATEADRVQYAAANADLAVEAYANALTRESPHWTLEKARKVAREALDRRLAEFRVRHKSQVERLQSATKFIGNLADMTGKK